MDRKTARVPFTWADVTSAGLTFARCGAIIILGVRKSYWFLRIWS